MLRGTFANIRIRNQLAPGTEGGWTRHLPDGETMTIYDAAMKYQQEGIPLIVLAGREYGTGSSRDWAAKGTYLLGVRAVIWRQLSNGFTAAIWSGWGSCPWSSSRARRWQSLGLTGEETFDLPVSEYLEPGAVLTVTVYPPDGTTRTFSARVRIDTPVELDYYRNGGILQTVLRKLLQSGS